MSVIGDWRSAPDFSKRFVLISFAAALAFLILAGRLWFLQVISSEKFSELADQNRTRYMRIEAPRGEIVDRNGERLVANRPAFNIVVMRQDVDDVDQLLQRLALLGGEELAVLQERWDKGKRLPVYRPITLFEDVDWNMVEIIQENIYRLHGVVTEIEPIRDYPNGEMAAHLFGYISEITENELQKLKGKGYRSGDVVGKTGVEAELEAMLRGSEGSKRIEVDVKGKSLRQRVAQKPLPGHTLVTTLDRQVQQVAEKSLAGRAGAAVMIDVNSGNVLAFASTPQFSPDAFARGLSGKEWQEMSSDQLHPLQNKVISGQYPPGSTYKIVTALAALKAGGATTRTTVDCEGSFIFAEHEYHCWKKKGHGKTNLKKALRESCDVWFYKVGLEIGIDAISETAFALGLGKKTGFMLPGEKHGLIPTKEWKRQRYHTSWFNGETVIASIGQGFVLTTPLQLAVMTATYANGGTLYQPQVISSIKDWRGDDMATFEPVVINRSPIDPAHKKAITNGLEAVVSEKRGTGWLSRLPGIRVAGKTGTAQVIRSKRDEEGNLLKDMPYHLRDHGLYVAFAPADKPEVAVSVVVEHGEHGSTAAAPVAGRMLAAYFGVAYPYDVVAKAVVVEEGGEE